MILLLSKSNIRFYSQRRLYESFPLWLKRSVCLVPFNWLAGSAYREVLNRGEHFEKVNVGAIRYYQEQVLGKMLRFAVAEVPAYRPFAEVVHRLKPFEALKAFPLLDKDLVQQDPERYLPASFHNIPHYETTTGGTSGNQLKVFLDDGSQSIEMGFMHRQWKRVGYTSRHRKATFRGVAFPNLKPGVFWQHNPIYNELQFSPFQMTESNLAVYVEQLVKFKPAFLHGYPSAIDTLAEYVMRHNLGDSLPPIRAALLGSEGATAQQRERIARAFATRVYSWYGHSERVVLAGECECSDSYHHFPDYGVLEIVNEDGQSCENEGERGEIVGTGLLNYSMPLIRYRTGDFATRLSSPCKCGRQWDRFTNVEGRWKQEFVIGRNGAKISIAALNMHGPLFENVVRYQYRQSVAGVCALTIVPSPLFREDDRIAIEGAYRAKLGDELEMKVELVDEIPLTARGKLKLLISDLL